MKLIGAFMAVVGAFSIGVIATYMLVTYRDACKGWQAESEKHASKGEPILVPESPVPTRSARLMTSETHRKMNESYRARRRGGSRRYSSHRRCTTKSYDPPSLHDCGFACILKAAGYQVNAHEVEKLREKVAARVYKAYLDDEIVHDMSVRNMIQSTDHTLAAYLAKLRYTLWASPIELCFAADALHVDIAISIKGSMIHHGAKPRFIVRLAKQHYTLYKMWKPVVPRGVPSCGRGGMYSASSVATSQAPWTWEDSVPNTVSILSLPPASPTVQVIEEIPEWANARLPPGLPLPEAEDVHVVKVHISPILRTDVVSINLSVRTSLQTSAMRQRLATILQTDEHRIRIVSLEGQPLPLHLATPTEIKVQDVWERDEVHYDVMDVMVRGEEQVKFVIRVDQLWTHAQLVQYLAKILSKSPLHLFLTDAQGTLWHYPEDRRRTTSIVVTFTQPAAPQLDLLGSVEDHRGGARTLSPTLPFPGREEQEANRQTEEDENEQDLENPNHPEELMDHVEQGVVQIMDVPANNGHQEGGERRMLTGQPDLQHAASASVGIRRPIQHVAAAIVDGGVLYTPQPRPLTRHNVDEHNARQRSRSRDRACPRRNPDTIASSTAPSEAMLTSAVWPPAPTPAQPEMMIKPVFDDQGVVGALRAFPESGVTDIVTDFISQVKPADLVQVEPMYAQRWWQVERIVLPPQTPCHVHKPIDMRATRWELYQEVRQVPVMAAGKVLYTLVLPWHVNLDIARNRLDDMAPQHMHWLLTAASPENWLVHQLALPEAVRLDLLDLETRRENERGGMRAEPKIPLRIHMKHCDEFQEWKVDRDTTLAYLIRVMAMEYDTSELNVLIMRGVHVPGIEECVAPYVPILQVYILHLMDRAQGMTQQHMQAAVLWQRCKKGTRPWEPLPVPRGPPISLGPVFEPMREVLHCYLRPAHDPKEIYVVHVHARATVADVLRNLEMTTSYSASSMLLVKEGYVLSTKEHAAVCNPISYLLLGDRLNEADICVQQAVEWSDLWSLSHSSSTPTSALPTSSAMTSCQVQIEAQHKDEARHEEDLLHQRGGVRTTHGAQQPRAVMIAWAEDKIRREIQGVNLLTARMLLKAEQRTVSAILHTRSAAQTREVLHAAFRRAGLDMEPTHVQHAEPQREDNRDLAHMTQALLNQTTITTQIADRLAAMPTNSDFMQLLEAIYEHVEMQRTVILQTERIMVFLRAVHGDQVMEQFRAQETPRLPQTPQSTQQYTQPSPDIAAQEQHVQPSPAQQHAPEQLPQQDLMPTPRRGPMALAPGGLINAIDAVRDASERSRQAAQGPATRPFRARQ